MAVTSQQSANVARYGREQDLPEQRELRAGPLRMIFEQGDLRYVRLGDREILRRVYVAIRDRNWATVPPRLSYLRVERGPESFHIEFESEHEQGDVDFAWRGTISGDASGTVTYSMDGLALSTFLRSRIGICLLHPPRETAGARFRAEKDDGSVEEGTLPRRIAPHQPVMDMRSFSHEVQPDLWAEVRFEGDVFEMEDQRNWTDASFKTYSTPLRLPYPVEVPVGTRITQKLTLTLRGEVPEQADDSTPSPTLRVEHKAVPLPRLGLGMASHGKPLAAREIERLKALHLGHLRVDLDLASKEHGARLRQAVEAAGALKVKLEVAVLLGDDAADELKELRTLVNEAKPPVAAWLILHRSEQGKQATSAQWLALAREHLASYDKKAPFGAGPNSNFTELNRGRPPVEAADLVFYPMNPQVHAFDNGSLVETLEAQAWTVESARAFSGKLPIAVSPVTLKQRFNPVATGPEPEPAPGDLPAQVDARQMSLFGAGWTLGSLEYLAQAGASSITYFETSGWRGVMETEDGSAVPERFPSTPGAVFLLYHVLADVGEFAGGEVVATSSNATLELDGIALRKGDTTRVVVANLSPHPIQAAVGGLGKNVAVRLLDETNLSFATQSPEEYRGTEAESRPTERGQLTLDLLPFAVATIDAAKD